MATINFRLRSKLNKNVSITVYISFGRNKLIEKNTGFTINPNDWSSKTNRPKQSNPENKNLTGNLNKLETFLFDNLNSDNAKGVLIDGYYLESKINECFNRVEKTDNGLLTNHIQYIIENANTRKIKGRSKIGISESRVKGYQTFKKLIENYQEHLKKQINFLDINRPFVDKFTNWLMNEKKYSVNYSGKQIDNLKTVCLDAEKNDIPVNAYIKQIEGFTESNEERYIVTLSTDELQKIKDADLQNNALKNARNWILLGCEIGQRASDLLNIKLSDFRKASLGYYLDVTQKKTGKTVTIGVIQKNAIDIIENDFPRKISTQKLNEYIKKVCELSGIDEVIEGKKFNQETKRKELGFYPKYELITTHSFRRSYATNNYKTFPTALLISVTGHSKESLFLDYINKREDKDANADLFMKLYEQLSY